MYLAESVPQSGNNALLVPLSSGPGIAASNHEEGGHNYFSKVNTPNSFEASSGWILSIAGHLSMSRAHFEKMFSLRGNIYPPSASCSPSGVQSRRPERELTQGLGLAPIDWSQVQAVDGLNKFSLNPSSHYPCQASAPPRPISVLLSYDSPFIDSN